MCIETLQALLETAELRADLAEGKVEALRTKVVCPACNPDMGTTPIVVSDKYIALYPTETFSLKKGWVQRQVDDAREEVSKWPTWLRKARGV